jgi:uncharacterized protein with FMN-binding domain
LKTIIRYGVIAIAAAIGLAVVLTVLCGRSEATYSPGVYSAQIVLHSNPVSVQVTVDRHSIQSVELINMGESEAVFYPVFRQSFDDIASQIVAMQSTEGVQLTSDNAVTGGIILDAVDAALDKAKK